MSGVGTILLTGDQLWRIAADFCVTTICAFRKAQTYRSIRFVAGPSSKLSVTNCQNRYPSPSMRSDLSQVRPQLSFTGGLLFADRGLQRRIRLDQPREHHIMDRAKQPYLREGSPKWLRKYGYLQWFHWSGLAPVLKPMLNAASPVRLPALSLRMRWAAMLQRVLLSAARPACSATTWVSADKPALSRVSARPVKIIGATGTHFPVVLSVVEGRQVAAACQI